MPEIWQQWYAHNINRWNGSATVQMISDAGYRAYHQLIMAEFESEDGMLPKDDKKLAILSRMGPRWRASREAESLPSIADEVLEAFEDGPNGRIYNEVIYSEWRQVKEEWEANYVPPDQVSAIRSAAGRAGNKKRWGNRKTIANGSQTDRKDVAKHRLQEQEQINTPPSRARDAEPENPDDPPEGLAMMQYANWLLERRGIPAVPATMLSCSAAIGTYGRKHGKPPHLAVVAFDAVCAGAQGRGQPVNKFFFEDPDKWEPKTNGGGSGTTQTNRAQERVNGSRSAFRKAAESRGIRGVDGFSRPDGPGVPASGNPAGDGGRLAGGVRDADAQIRDSEDAGGVHGTADRRGPEILSPTPRGFREVQGAYGE